VPRGIPKYIVKGSVFLSLHNGLKIATNYIICTLIKSRQIREHERRVGITIKPMASRRGKMDTPIDASDP